MHLLLDLLFLFVTLAASASDLSSAQVSGFYVWPSDWVVVNNGSLPSTSSDFHSMDGPFRVIVSSSGDPIFSQNATFAFGFVDLNSTGNFLLAVAMAVGLSSPPGAVLWSANRNRPVKENASLRIAASGNLVLLDWDETEVWNSGEGNVKAIAMQEFGDLELFNTTNSSEANNPVWRSWVSPIQQTLVQGQALYTGSQLVSNASATNSSEGIYSLVMEPGGMVLYTRTGSNLQPYWVQGFVGYDTFESIHKPCFLNTSLDEPTSNLVFSGQDINLDYVGDAEKATAICPAINTSSSVSLPFGSTAESPYRFVRLDNDGNLRGYEMARVAGQGNTNVWAVDYELFPTGSAAECRLPNVCGPYGICLNGQCSCPGSGTTDAFKQVSTLNAKTGCSPPRPLLCNQTRINNSSVNHHYMELEGVDYFLNSFSTQEPNVSTLEQCKSLCSANCSCEAFFFYTNSSSCFQATHLKSLLVVSSTDFKAYLKVQNVAASPPASPINQSSSSSSNSPSKGSIAGIVLGATATVLLLLLSILRWRKANGPNFMDPDEGEEAAFLEALPGLPLRFTLKELRVATQEFKKRLGSGGFGPVYEGVLKDGSRVAVKRLNGARQGHKEFRTEVATIGSINHVNLVRLRGFCAEKGERLLIYELVENGSLDKWIFKDIPKSAEEHCRRNCVLTWEMRLSVAIGTARGLAYLHEDCREAILHLDIKPQNILVNEHFVPKVADFGMAKLMEGDMTEVVTAVRGTPGYLAPEWLRASIATKKCDVYSFGMVLLELIGGRKNFDLTLGSDPSFVYFPTWAKLRALEGNYMDLLDESIKEKITLEQQEEVARVSKVAFCCIHEDPQMRPPMGAVVNMLEGNDTSIPTLAALGLTLRGEEGELMQGPSWTLMSRTSAIQLSGPR